MKLAFSAARVMQNLLCFSLLDRTSLIRFCPEKVPDIHLNAMQWGFSVQDITQGLNIFDLLVWGESQDATHDPNFEQPHTWDLVCGVWSI